MRLRDARVVREGVSFCHRILFYGNGLLLSYIQNFPLGYRPFLGYEGTNQIADLVYNSFTLGMEDHLLEIFGGHDNKEVIMKSLSTDVSFHWSQDALSELGKIPGFVRGKVKRNTEKFARENGINNINIDVMYAAKESAGA